MQLTIEKQNIPDPTASWPTPNPPATKSPAELTRIVERFAATDGWLDRVRLRNGERWYERLHLGPNHDIWVISWMPGQSTGFHDHGESAGALVVVVGELEEHNPGRDPIALQPGKPRSFGTGYAHDVRNTSLAPAISIHAYSPPLDEMNEFELDGTELVPRATQSERAEQLDQPWRTRAPRTTQPLTLTRGALSIDQLLFTARARLLRLSPQAAREALLEGDAVLIDIRPAAQRAAESTIPGALIVERNVLEWRLDPTSDARLPIATGHDLRVIVFCSEGYTSSLAAASLQNLGLWRATDIVGGFQAWQTAGLPTTTQQTLSTPKPPHL
jgi:rhodanese-related sulfurtransferase/predicted metal-dependent enzyme (double-stranded beta helix superfamily)